MTTQGGLIGEEEKEFALVVDGSTLAHILPDEAVVGTQLCSKISPVFLSSQSSIENLKGCPRKYAPSSTGKNSDLFLFE